MPVQIPALAAEQQLQEPVVSIRRRWRFLLLHPLDERRAFNSYSETTTTLNWVLMALSSRSVLKAVRSKRSSRPAGVLFRVDTIPLWLRPTTNWRAGRHGPGIPAAS